MSSLEAHLRTIADFPKPGIQFLDIAPILQNPKHFSDLTHQLEALLKDVEFDQIVAIESRGFLIGSALAYKMQKGLVMVRKPGKLPGQIVSLEYDLEYGTDKIEMLKDSFKPGDKVLILDDILATGGTAGAAHKLCSKLEANIVGYCFFIELGFLNGRSKLPEAPIHSLIIKD